MRAELGYPIMVTPFPQMVVSQALFNVIGASATANVSDQVIRYVLGSFGRPTGADRPGCARTGSSTGRGRASCRPSRRRRRPPSCASSSAAGISDEEFLLRAHMPADQVDAMLAAGPAPRHYNPVAGARADAAAGAGAREDRPRPRRRQAGPAAVRAPSPPEGTARA